MSSPKPKLCNFINGEFVAPVSGNYIDNVNPATTEVINLIPDSDVRDVELALTAAKDAEQSWGALSYKERAEYLFKISDAMESKKYYNRLVQADIADMGKPIQMMKTIDMENAIAQFRTFGHMVQSVTTPYYQKNDAVCFEHREPIGIVGIITPWNFPLMLFCIKLSASMAMGNVSIVKPSELSPTSSTIMCEIFNDIGLPSGVVNVIQGYGIKAAEPFVENPAVGAISFTGGSVTGSRVSSIAAPKLKKLQLELGGKNPAVVFDDCYFDETVDKLLFSSFLNTGQVCCSGSRILVQRGIYDKFVAEFKKRTKATYSRQIGDPNNTSTLLGPLVSYTQYKKVQKYLKLAIKEGGNIILGGKYGGDNLGLNGKYKNGYYFEPTIIINLNDKCRCAMEEIFGPIVTIHPFDTEQDALRIANQVEYGLAASVWSSDIRRANRIARGIKAGAIWVNCYFEFDERMAYGGYKRSGINRENGRHSIEFFSEIKSIFSKL